MEDAMITDGPQPAPRSTKNILTSHAWGTEKPFLKLARRSANMIETDCNHTRRSKTMQSMRVNLLRRQRCGLPRSAHQTADKREQLEKAAGLLFESNRAQTASAEAADEALGVCDCSCVMITALHR